MDISREGPAGFWSCDHSFWKHRISQWSWFLNIKSVWRMSVNIPNGSSGYFYSQLFRGLLDSQHCVPSLAERRSGQEGWRDAKFCVNVDVCISSKRFLFFRGLRFLLPQHNFSSYSFSRVLRWWLPGYRKESQSLTLVWEMCCIQH